MEDLDPAWVDYLGESLQIPAFVEHGLWFALATAARDCLSDTVATCVCLQAAHKQRSAQAIVLYAMDLEAHLGREFPITAARERFMRDPGLAADPALPRAPGRDRRLGRGADRRQPRASSRRSAP